MFISVVPPEDDPIDMECARSLFASKDSKCLCLFLASSSFLKFFSFITLLLCVPRNNNLPVCRDGYWVTPD